MLRSIDSPELLALRKALPPVPHLDALLARHQYDIAAYLVAIHRQPLKREDRYLILCPQSRPAFYVQCCLDDADRKVLCECVSGYFNEAIVPTPERLAALVALGFGTDASEDNYKQERLLKGAQSYLQLAALLIETLARICDLQPSEILAYDAPLVPERPMHLAAFLKVQCAEGTSALLADAAYYPDWAREADENALAKLTRGDLSKLSPTTLAATAVDYLRLVKATEHTGHSNRLMGKIFQIADALRATDGGKSALLSLLADGDPAIRLSAAYWCKPFDRAASLAALHGLAERKDEIGRDAQGSLRWAEEEEKPRPQAPLPQARTDWFFNRTRNAPPQGIDRATLEQQLKAAFPGDLAARLSDLIRPAIRLWPRRPPARLSPTASHWGGMPAVPAGWTWPAHEREPLFFLGQINCADLGDFKNAEGLPRSGLLAFFGDHDTIMGCGDCVGAVFYWPDIAQLRLAEAPVEDFEIMPVCALHLIETFELPHAWSTLVEPLALSKAQKSTYWDIQHAASLLGIAEADHHENGVSKLLGWPNLIQRDVEALAAMPDEQRLLAQIGEYENGTDSQGWGPGGLIYFTIGEANLAAGRFSKAEIEMQCT